jgi:hypothetical protein
MGIFTKHSMQKTHFNKIRMNWDILFSILKSVKEEVQLMLVAHNIVTVATFRKKKVNSLKRSIF